jgi:hypothetical protein
VQDALGRFAQGLGTLPTTTMRTPRRSIASSTLTYANVIVVSSQL